MGVNARRAGGLLLLMWFLATVTVGLQFWIGDKTIYAKGIEQTREEFHYGILANKAPGGAGWGAVGGLSIQKRIGVVYLAEGVRKFTNLSVGRVYKLLDSVFLFVALVGLYFYLRRWVPDTYALIGTLYFCGALPFQLFHPWDRLQLALWIGLLSLVADRRFLILVCGLFVSILVKFDTVLLPFFYLLVHLRKDGWQKTVVETLVLLVVGFGTYIALGQLFPSPLDTAGFTLGNAGQMLQRNIQTIVDMNLRFPPLLVHALPILLALLFWRSKDRFVLASVAFGLVLTAVYVSFSLYEEVRAHMVVLVLMLPSALSSIRRLLDYDAQEISNRLLK